MDTPPVISEFASQLMASPITEEELYASLKSMKALDGLTVKFYLHFWDIVKGPLLEAFNYSYDVGRLPISQRRGLIRLLPKKLQNLLLIQH